MKKTFAVIFGLSFLLFLSTTAFAQGITLRMALGDPENSEMGVVGNTVKEYVEDHSGESMKVQLFFGGALGPEPETIHSVRHGMLDMTCVGIANVVPFVKKLGVLNLPYLFQDLEQVVKATTGPAGELLNSYAQEGMLRVLTWTYTDFRYLSNAKHPVTKLSDIRGLKIRIPLNDILAATYSSWGAEPTPVSWPSTFSALQQGMVDGQCYGYIGFKAMKFYDARQKYITEVHYTYQLQPLLISERVFRKLTPEQQQILIDAGKAAQEAVLAYQIAESSKAKKELMEKGVEISELTDEDEWRKIALSRVWPEMADSVGGEEAINTFLQSFGQPQWHP